MAWKLFWRNLGPVLLVGLLNVVVAVIFGIVVGLPAVLVAIVLFLFAMASNFNITVIGLVLALGLLLGILVLILSGIARTFSSVLWTLTYLEIVKKGLATDVNPA